MAAAKQIFVWNFVPDIYYYVRRVRRCRFQTNPPWFRHVLSCANCAIPTLNAAVSFQYSRTQHTNKRETNAHTDQECLLHQIWYKHLSKYNVGSRYKLEAWAQVWKVGFRWWAQYFYRLLDLRFIEGIIAYMCRAFL